MFPGKHIHCQIQAPETELRQTGQMESIKPEQITNPMITLLSCISADFSLRYHLERLEISKLYDEEV
jgi:hypothetical protein